MTLDMIHFASRGSAFRRDNDPRLPSAQVLALHHWSSGQQQISSFSNNSSASNLAFELTVFVKSV